MSYSLVRSMNIALNAGSSDVTYVTRGVDAHRWLGSKKLGYAGSDY